MNKKLLKYISFILSLWLLFGTLSCNIANAMPNTTQYVIDELSMTLDIPDEIKIITQGIKQSDPIFRTETFDYITIMSKIRDDNDYFYGKNINGDYEFEVEIKNNPDIIENFSLLSEKKQNSIQEEYSGQPDMIETQKCLINGVAYIKGIRSLNNEAGRFFTEEYYTVFNNYDITVKLTSYNDNISNYERHLLNSVVESIQYPKKKSLDIKKVFDVTELLSFLCLIVIYIIIVFFKLSDIKREKFKEERKQKRMLQRQERDELEKKKDLALQNKKFDNDIDINEAIANFEET